MRLSLFSKKTEKRAVTVPWSVGLDDYSVIGVDKALSLVPVFAANRLLADEISTLPLHCYRGEGSSKSQITTPALLRNPGAIGTVQEWVYQLVTSLASWGNAYGFVTGRDGLGYPTGLEWINPSLVSVDESKPYLPRYYINGRPVPTEDVVHIRWFLQPGSVKGLSPIDALRETISTGLGAQSFKEQWFANGGTPPGVFKNANKTVDPAESELIRQRLTAALRRNQPLVHGNDWDYTPVGIPPDTAEFVATMKLSATQVANAYGLPPTKIGGEQGGSLTYATVEMEALDLVRALRPWLSRIESHLSLLLPGGAYVKFNPDALVSVDLTARMAAYAVQRQIGLRNLDELRELEDLAPLPGGQGSAYLPAPAPPPAEPRSPHA